MRRASIDPERLIGRIRHNVNEHKEDEDRVAGAQIPLDVVPSPAGEAQ